MVARICPNTTFDPAFRLLDNSFSHLELSGLGAKTDMYQGSNAGSGDGYGGQLSQQQQQAQQQGGGQQRPQLGRRLTYNSSSNLLVLAFLIILCLLAWLAACYAIVGRAI